MKTFIVILLFLAYYVLLHFWVFRIYKADSPSFPRCLLYNNMIVTAVGCTGIAAMALSLVLNSQTDVRLLLLYYLGMMLLSVLTVTDLKEKRIPNRVLLIMLGVWAVYILANMAASSRACASMTVSLSLRK